MSEPLLISTSDIAELVDERLPVVSTWRSRFSEGPNPFPEPAGGTPARPLFDFDQVREWMAANRPEKDLQAGLLKIRVWSEIRKLSENFDQFDLVFWLHLELRALKALLAGVDSDESSTFSDADEYVLTKFAAGRREELRTIKSLIERASANELIEVSDFTLGRLSAGYGRSGGGTGAVKSGVSSVLASAALGLANTSPTPTIYDPACGIGESLIATFTALEQVGRRGHVVGVEVDARVAIVASIRFQLRDIPATIATADTLSSIQFEKMRADVIVSEPPLGLKWSGVWSPEDPRSRFGVPPTRNADLAWVVEAASKIKDGAGAVVLTGMGALSHGEAEERIRASLLRSGAVETIIALPSQLLQYSSIALALWVLRAPSPEEGDRAVTLVDASSLDLAGGSPSKRIDWVVENIRGLVADPVSADTLDGVDSTVVRLDDLLRDGADLTPTRWTSQPDHAGVVSALSNETDLLAQQIRGFKPTTPDFNALVPAQHVVTIREMTETPSSREAKLWAGRGSSVDGEPDDRITSRDVSGGALRDLQPEDAAEPGFRTAPGDIVFTTMRTGTALVDTQGGHRIASGVYTLRLDPSSRFDPHYVAVCLAAKWNERHHKGDSMKNVKPGDLEIPLLPRDAQLQWVLQFRNLETVKSDARKLLEIAERLEGAAQDALRFGHAETSDGAEGLRPTSL